MNRDYQNVSNITWFINNCIYVTTMSIFINSRATNVIILYTN